MTRSTSRERIARNFVDRYGIAAFQDLLAALKDGQSGEAIAARYKVSRERVRQWKNAFGQTVTYYEVHGDIARLLE